jgi:hypothetical protein
LHPPCKAGKRPLAGSKRPTSNDVLMKSDEHRALPLKDAAAAYDQFGEGIKHEVARYSVAVCTLDNNAPEGNGSGTCVKVGPRYFVFTAAHVVRGYAADALWLVGKAGAMNRRVRPLRVGLRGGEKGETVDVGYIEIDADAIKRMSLEALPVERVTGRGIVIDEFIALAGLPVEMLTQKPRGPNKDDVDMVWTPFIAVTMQKDRSKWHAEVDKGFELEADYPENFEPLRPGGTPQELPDAPGMSGGGYWLCNLPSRGTVWSATQIELTGTITAWHGTERYISANLIANTLSLLADDYPDLKPALTRK